MPPRAISLLDDVALALLGLPGQEFLDRLLTRTGIGWLQGDAAIDAGLGEAAGRAVDLALPARSPRSCPERHDQRLLAGRAGGRAAGEVGLTLNFMPQEQEKEIMGTSRRLPGPALENNRGMVGVTDTTSLLLHIHGADERLGNGPVATCEIHRRRISSRTRRADTTAFHPQWS